MTNEEAIALLEDQMNFNRTMQRGWGSSMIETDAGNIVDGALYANQHKDVADALELAINALRAGGTDTNVPTMPAGQPLTLEQLRGMDGQPVFMRDLTGGTLWTQWIIFERHTDDGFIPRGGGFFGCSTYGIKWLAYAYHPAHINRERVEKVFSGCEICKEKKEVKSDNFCGAATMRIVGDSIDLRGDEKKTKFFGHIYAPSFSVKFCPFCGKPLTDEAVQMVMERLEALKDGVVD